ncbi:MAG: NUDIX domain-containing protein [Lachnospiraceae bacterium]|nr:NUDIX domain-containing protein [Lachnospiraceae bacterium]
MKILTIFDSKNYDNTTSVFEKYNPRAIIMRDGKLAMQRSRNGIYKIPGGGREGDESFLDTLVREVSEETGLIVRASSVYELGEITEIRRDIFDETVKYICHSLFYFCEIEDEQRELNLTASEKEKGFYVEWATPQEIYDNNVVLSNEPWIMRDTAFIKMLIDGDVVLPINR